MSDQEALAGSSGELWPPGGIHQPKTPDQPPKRASLPVVVEATPRRRPPHFWRAVLRQMFHKTYEDRVLGLAAEAGFWGIVSLPSFALSVFGAIGYFRGLIGDHAINSVRDDVLRAARDVLTPNTVNTDVAPLVNEILARGQPAVISIGFVIALWAGSTCMADYVNTITVAYEQRGLRPWHRTRLRSLYLYLLAVAAGIVILPALALGPNEIAQLFPHPLRHGITLTIKILYIPVVGLGSILVVACLYRLSLPRPVPFRRGLPGATLAVAVWLSGSFGVRTYLSSSFHNGSAYGALSAPIAALIFFYITALAVLLGAELNSAIDTVHHRPVPLGILRQPRPRRRLLPWRARSSSRQTNGVTQGGEGGDGKRVRPLR